MKGVTAFVLAGGRVEELGVLTLRRAKSALPFAGSYRTIDFAMSNLARSGIERVGVLSQYRPTSLMDHVGQGESWGLIGRGREVRMLPPYQGESGVDWYRGTADAVYQNLSFAQDSEDVLIVSGDHVYNMDYRPLLEEHRQSGADLTMAFKPFSPEVVVNYGNIALDDSGRAVSYVEKPEKPLSELGSLTIYVFKHSVLKREIERGMAGGRRLTHMHGEIIPSIVKKGNARVHVFQGYWAYTRTLDDYYRAHMELFDPGLGLALDYWGVQTNPESSGLGDAPPAVIGDKAVVDTARLSAGCEVRGTVIRSVLSPGVLVEEGAVVKDSVLLHGTCVRRGAKLERVVSDKLVLFEEGCHVGHCEEARTNEKAGDGQTCGVTAIAGEAVIGRDARVGANVQIATVSGVGAGVVVPDGRYVEVRGDKPWRRVL